MSEEFTVLDLFSGCGGLSLGFIHEDYKVLAGIDDDETALETFEKNHKGAVAFNLDLSDFGFIDQLKEELDIQSVDVIVAGPPCQGFSLTGPRNFEDDRNKLYLAVIKAVEEFRPKAFVIENVTGLATLYDGKIKSEIIRRFQKMEYNVNHKVLLAADYGVPQMRRRLFFVGLDNPFGKFRFPLPLLSEQNYITCSDAISDLPAREKQMGKDVDEYLSEPLTDYQREMRGNCKVLYNHVGTNHTNKVKNVIKQVPEGGNHKDLPDGVGEHRKFNEAWTRYHSQRPSRTIDTGHRNHFHYKYNRVPTVRENARLQSFPDDFRFYGSKTKQNRQVGNAVPPKLAAVLALSIKKYLLKEAKPIGQSELFEKADG